MLDKPPLGLLPKDMWDNLRLGYIISAINRYMLNSKEIPLEWVEEYNELVKKVVK